ncbi:MAG: methyltransferase domain-containing protein [Alphaproteobacteria bacterium]|nr:methyltransferase domain-containing protein [Alphaproteobacteria bacterium]
MFSANAVTRDFSRAASTYDAHGALQQQALAECARLLAPHVAKDAAVLDAGCGTGRLMEQGVNWRITGVDLAPGMCASAHARGMRVCAGDIAALPFPGAQFSGVLCSLVLQWLNAPAQALSELHRVCTGGASAALCVFEEGTLHELKAVAGKETRVSPFFTQGAIERMAQEAGWQVMQTHSRRVVEYYADARALFQRLKAIGATNKLAHRPRGLATPAWLARVDAHYRDAFGIDGVLPASWQLHFLLLQKVI